MNKDAMTDTSHAIIHGAEARARTEPTLCLHPKSTIRPTWKSKQDAVLKERKRNKELCLLSPSESTPEQGGKEVWLCLASVPSGSKEEISSTVALKAMI